MKIVLNGLPVIYPISGVGRYTLELGRALEHLLGEGNIFWFGKELSGNGLNGPVSEDFIPRHRIQYSLKNILRKIPGTRTWMHLWRDRQFKSYVKEIKPSLYHETNYTPYSFEDGPTLITLYDLSFVKHPEWHPSERVKYFERYCIKQLPKVDAIITISEFSKKEIIDLLGIPSEKIFMTPLGVRQDCTPLVKQMEKLPQEYILFLGNLEPRKNLATLLEAYRSLPKKLKDRHPLVIAGASGWETHELKKALHLFKMEESPILPGYIPQKFLPNLYRGASVFVYPSFYEGFGLPVIEAMACGIPVIASKTSSFPEIVDGAGILINPYDPNELKEAIMQALEDSQIRRELSEKGLKRAKLFSWKKCASETLTIYEKILGVRKS
jgi:alpha-1,3-rhamnosyl/mannosyltransferase